MALALAGLLAVLILGSATKPAIYRAAKGETLLTVFTADVVNLLGRVVNWDGSRWS